MEPPRLQIFKVELFSHEIFAFLRNPLQVSIIGLERGTFWWGLGKLLAFYFCLFDHLCPSVSLFQLMVRELKCLP